MLLARRSAIVRRPDGPVAPRVGGLGVDLGGGGSCDLDFRAIPCRGDHALIEGHCVSKRSRRQKGVLAFLARDAEARLFRCANAAVRKGGQNDGILRFADCQRERTGELPRELIFDLRLATDADLAMLDRSGIYFAALRKRTRSLLAGIAAAPETGRRRVRPANVGRVVIVKTIAAAIDFFHMDALSAAVPMKADLDPQPARSAGCSTCGSAAAGRPPAREACSGTSPRRQRTSASGRAASAR